MKYVQYASALALIVGAAGAAGADEDDWHISFAGSAAFQQDSDNSGVTEAFTTGNIGDGTTLTIDSGSLSTFTTDFNVGFGLSLEARAASLGWFPNRDRVGLHRLRRQ